MLSWTSLLPNILINLTIIFIIVCFCILVLKAAPALIARNDWIIVSAMSAAVAAFIALSQTNSTSFALSRHQAILFGNLKATTNFALSLLERPTPKGQLGEVSSPFVLTRQQYTLRRPLLQEDILVLQDFKAEDMPSSKVLLALMRARAGVRLALNMGDVSQDPNSKIDFDVAVDQLVQANAMIDQEGLRLYPIYSFGFIKLSVGPPPTDYIPTPRLP